MKEEEQPTPEARARTQELINRISKRSQQFKQISALAILLWILLTMVLGRLLSGWFGKNWFYFAGAGALLGFLIDDYVLKGSGSFARKLQARLFDFPTE
jgi:hypothetical protein